MDNDDVPIKTEKPVFENRAARRKRKALERKASKEPSSE